MHFTPSTGTLNPEIPCEMHSRIESLQIFFRSESNNLASKVELEGWINKIHLELSQLTTTSIRSRFNIMVNRLR